jgi:hypothetical protein
MIDKRILDVRRSLTPAEIDLKMAFTAIIKRVLDQNQKKTKELMQENQYLKMKLDKLIELNKEKL